ncbi:MAG: AAA family ATPase [Pyrinomonadaceae bacterium]|nr:AAA family ATPase [Sphingobacteriaceae bacterium]
MPYLSNITLPFLSSDAYPFNITSFKQGISIRLKSNVTFFVGENGSGKSTLLEAIAEKCGFNLRGGNKNHNLNTGHNFSGYESPLAGSVALGWTPKKISDGFFMRAESFYNFASLIDELAMDDNRILKAYGGKSLHQQSHGESFLSLFNNQFENGIYILDEPEAALSPARILAFMTVVSELEKSGRAQFIIATHSPMLLCYPGASIYQFDDDGIHETTCEATEHFQLTKSFLENPALYLRHLFGE